MRRKINKISKKISSLETNIKVRILTIFLIIGVLCFNVISYTLTYGDLIIDFQAEQDYLESGIYGDNVIINDLEADLHYYEGLNYTYSNNGVLPTGDNQNIYNSSNLVKVYIQYNGQDIDRDGDSWRGYVSHNERVSKIDYYKYFKIEDGYVNIELIDNPFADRPDNMGFGGWVTDYPGAFITYDPDIHAYYAKIPVSSNLDSISITFHARWMSANIVTSYGTDIDTAVTNLDNRGFVALGYDEVRNPDANYMYLLYYGGTAGYYSRFPMYAYDAAGNHIGEQYCYSSGGCVYYYISYESEYIEGREYYRIVDGQLIPYENNIYVSNGDFEFGYSDAGYYKKVDVNNGESLTSVYDSSGNYLSSVTCNTSIGCSYYELIQYSEDENGNASVTNEGNVYYKYVNRDMNIVLLRGDASSAFTNSKPCTVTGLNNGTYSQYTINISDTYIRANEDLRIEYVRLRTNRSKSYSSSYYPTSYSDSSKHIYGNANNLKIGRGISCYSSYVCANAVIGANNNGVGSSSNIIRYRTVVESGLYNNMSGVAGGVSTSYNYYVDANIIYGSDFDRATNNNSLLEVYRTTGASFGGSIYSSSDYGVSVLTNVKSGSFGTAGTNGENIYAYGVYAGGLNTGCYYSARTVLVEGGYIFNLIGGPLTYSDRTNVNDIFLLVKGGEVDFVIGGAALDPTTGNRIVSVTGGIINRAIYGGSNGNDGVDGDGKVEADTLVYVGGNTIVGNDSLLNSSTIFGEEIGSVFGIGNGNEVSESIGTARNSMVIINGGHIKRNVYGGGNFGAVGLDNADGSTTTTKIKMLDGVIDGAIYGGGNNNGAGASNITANINIDMSGGKVGYIYGGSNQKGTIYGNVKVNVIGGEVVNSVYGGGQGGYLDSTNSGTFVRDGILVTVGDADSNLVPIINDSVYGGSAFGTVNGTTGDTTISSNSTKVIVNKGLITNVFGGGEGNDTYTPYVKGDITVTINDGTITNVYGGNDANGKPNGNIEVYINGGTITNTFGGGEQTSVNTTNIYLNGGMSNNIYGGSNQSGEVGTTNIITTGGKSLAVYGGNNQGGTTNITNVTINGGDITDVYGGGEKTSVLSNTNVNLNNQTVNVFGGSNVSGTIPVSNITVTNGTAKNVYGGNNQGGTTTTSNVFVYGSNIENVYGGGLNAFTTTSNLNIYHGYITNLYGGGSEAGVSNTYVKLGTPLIENVFGGSNILGDVNTSNISNLSNVNENTIYNGTTYDELRVYNLYGGNNEGGTTVATNINLTSGNIDVLYGGGNKAITDTTNVVLKTVQINDSVYGGGNQATVETVSLKLDESVIGTTNSIGNVYGGGNNAAVNGNISLDILNKTNIYGNLYAGGNLGNVIGIATTTINNSTISESVYGGGNQATIGNKTDQTIVSNLTIENSNIKDVYGGGNSAGVNGSTNVLIDASDISGNVYGAGNGLNSIVSGDTTGELNPAVVTGNTNLKITGGTNIGNSIYGGGNLGFVHGNTNVTLEDITINENIYGGGNAAQVLGSVYLNLLNSKVLKNIYAGGNGINATISKNTNLIVTDSLVDDSIYGGGNAAKVLGTTSSTVTNTTVLKSIYAGGNGQTARVIGNTNLNIDGTTNVGKHVFGGGNAAPTGTEENNNSNSVVNIAGATISGNVYGGANTSVLYGITNLNIGYDALSIDGLKKGNIEIGGTVFGGGEANEEGSEVIDFDFISVTKGITIKIDGNDHDIFTIEGSIFGSGNASMTEGYSHVYISNYGTSNDIKKNVSLQRADFFEINNCHIELSGATDRTNEFSDVLFTLSRIDELKILNNTNLYLKTGSNLVKKFTSGLLVDDKIEFAKVTIDSETKRVEKNVDNRLYMYEGKNLNIATNQTVTLYGEVSGMTFLGMYLVNQNNEIITAMYDSKYDYGSTAISGDLYFFTSGSYVLGSHKANHNTEVDGFYSNFVSEETANTIEVKYITPTPEASDFYMWVIGEQVISYDIHLTASKYSTLGIEEFSLLNFAKSNTEFTILGFNYSGLADDVQLVPSDEIPRIADSSTNADNIMGLSIKSGQTGWITIGETEFLTNENNQFVGTTTYESENSTTVPSLVFYLYHSKNLKTTGNMGTVTISMVAITPIDELNNEVERINFNVELSRALYTADEYEATMTPGKQYEMFASNPVNITSDSSLSAYYSLFIEKDITPYKTGYHRSLTSSFALPVNTKITMIDYSNENLPIYYYYVVTENDYEKSLEELSQEHEVSYLLSKFVKMGSSSLGNNYDDSTKNQIYYNDETKIAEEEFIFIVDFKESNIEQDYLNNSLMLELRNEEGQTLISVLGIEQENLVYNLYYDKNAIIDLTSEDLDLSFYNGNNINFTINTNFIQQSINNKTIYDTNYYDQKLGIKISIYDSDDNLLTSSNLMGIYFEYNGLKYYPRYDGTTRINIAPKIANVSSKITMHGENSNLAGGNYKIVIESFGSPDGIYYGVEVSDTLSIDLNTMNTIYGLKATMNEQSYFWDKDTGKNLLDSSTLNLNLRYESGLNNPNLRIALYRRSYESIYSTEYTQVDLLDYLNNQYEKTNNEFEYYLSKNPVSNIDYFLYMKENLISGTYKLKISLYDNDTYVGSIYEYLIIK